MVMIIAHRQVHNGLVQMIVIFDCCLKGIECMANTLPAPRLMFDTSEVISFILSLEQSQECGRWMRLLQRNQLRLC